MRHWHVETQTNKNGFGQTKKRQECASGHRRFLQQIEKVVEMHQHSRMSSATEAAFSPPAAGK